MEFHHRGTEKNFQSLVVECRFAVGELTIFKFFSVHSVPLWWKGFSIQTPPYDFHIPAGHDEHGA